MRWVCVACAVACMCAVRRAHEARSGEAGGEDCTVQCRHCYVLVSPPRPPRRQRQRHGAHRKPHTDATGPRDSRQAQGLGVYGLLCIQYIYIYIWTV